MNHSAEAARARRLARIATLRQKKGCVGCDTDMGYGATFPPWIYSASREAQSPDYAKALADYRKQKDKWSGLAKGLLGIKVGTEAEVIAGKARADITKGETAWKAYKDAQAAKGITVSDPAPTDTGLPSDTGLAVTGADTATPTAADASSGGFPVWILVAGGVAVLGVVGVIVIKKRRKAAAA